MKRRRVLALAAVPLLPALPAESVLAVEPAWDLDLGSGNFTIEFWVYTAPDNSVHVSFDPPRHGEMAARRWSQ